MNRYETTESASAAKGSQPRANHADAASKTKAEDAIEQAKQKAEADVYNALEKQAIAYCASKGVRDAGSIFHDAFYGIAKKHAVTAKKFRPFFFRRMKDRCKNQYARELKWAQRSCALPVNFEALLCTETEDTALEDLKDVVAQALQALGPIRQAILRLQIWEDFSTEEIADRLGISISNVKTHAFRARKQLENALRPILTGSHWID